MSDNTQPPVPPQGSPVPPPHEPSADASDASAHDAPAYDAASGDAPANDAPSFDTPTSEAPAPSAPSDAPGQSTPDAPPSYGYDASAAQPAYDPDGYASASTPPAYDPNGYSSAPSSTPDQGAYDHNAYGQQAQQAPGGYQQGGYQQGGYQQAPSYGQNPYTQQQGGYPSGPGYGQAPGGYNPNVDPQAKSRVVAGILGILLGAFGVHRFYLGYTGMGILMLGIYLLGLLTSWLIIGLFLMAGVGIWALVEGILILTKSPSFQNDATGRPLRDG